ncbi:inactive serine protease PAMR1 [Pygocentrus nattereri]|uniref:inactive serine protease PAMR1 n=1 Tax=Pygocentrus nattereri TaxID=42514 RepID=UPI00189164AE|nr:inactive serine protease PAMR1 [Pygocentrus nattereri]
MLFFFVGRNWIWMFSLFSKRQVYLLALLFHVLQLCCSLPAWSHASRAQDDPCPGPRWNAMCRSCCEYERIVCKCPSQGTKVGYAVPCCRNDIQQCDPCIIYQGCNVFDNCKRCNNGTWEAKDDFYVSGTYCTECRQGWTGGSCLTCGEVIRRPQGHVILESYPINAKCDWTLHVSTGLTMELRFTMLSLEFDHSCRHDYVEVRDGDSLDSRVIGRYCGNDIPSPIRSSGDSLHIRFVSDGYNNYDGFSATFQELTACSFSPCMNDGICSLDPIKTFRCACRAGFTGARCENNPSGCVTPQKPAHGDLFLQYNDGDIATTIQYLCYKPYKLKGVSQRMCLSNGTWSGTAPTCIKEKSPTKKVCTSLPQPHHGFSKETLASDGKIKSVEFLCNNPYVLSGSSKRTCQRNGTWSGTQPQCIRACREPKISKLVRQKVVKPLPPSRNSPLHKLYSSSQPTSADEDSTDSTAVLPTGFHHLYTSIEYECTSQLYQPSGSTHRTCLKTGKWSGRHVSCSPVCGKLASKPQSLAETHWPWHVAVYHHLPDHDSFITGRTKRRGDTFSLLDNDDSQKNVAEEHSWQLVCSGALVSQQAVLLPAHCVTEPGQSVPLSTAELRVVLGKHYLSDLRDRKRLQHMQVLEILVHPSYDPNAFESDLAILKLAEKAKISTFISPVCLPHMHGGEVIAQQAYITGWSIAGQHEPTPDTDSEVSRTGLVELADVAQCERQYALEGISINVSDNMLCGRQHPISSATVCPGRTGGVVLLPTDTRDTSGSMLPDQRSIEVGPSDPRWELLGLVSFGYNLQNCNPCLYTVYTRVTNFKNWIEKNIK